MSRPTNDPPNKVVDLHTRQGGTASGVGAGERGGELVRSCRRLTQKALGEAVSTLFDKVDDALFDMAEKAENTTAQTNLFDGMREVRRKRPLMERLFQEGLGERFNAFTSSSSGNDKPKESKAASKDGLSLVEEEALEEDLAVSAMVGKADNRCARALFALEQRLSVLVGGSKIESENNPLAPRAVCESFQVTLGELDAQIQVKLLILKLFDKYVCTALDSLYDEISLKLIEAGVLPQLKHQIPAAKRPGTGAPLPAGYSEGAIDNEAAEAETAAAQQGPMGQPGAGYGAAPSYPAVPGYGGDSSLQIEILNTLRGLLADRRQQFYASSGQPVSNGPSFATNDLVNALSVLQTQTVSRPPAASSYGSFADQSATMPLPELKQELVQQLNSMGSGDEKHRMASADEDTIDLVGMLFEFILQDRNLPSQVQALLARLQIPYLKAAILDREMFAHKDHAARVLLDELAKVGLGWSEESDRDGRIFGKIKEIVERLLNDFDDDVNLFEHLLEDLHKFINSQQRRAEVAEQRTAETTKGKEKLAAARKTAAKEILKRIEDKRLPEVIRNLLTRPWANVIVLTILRQGEQSHQWRTSLRIADELVWSAEPKHSDAERTRLKALVPELEKALRQGLGMVAYHDNDIELLLGDLRSFYDVQLDPGADAEALLEEPGLAPAALEQPAADSADADVDVDEAEGAAEGAEASADDVPADSGLEIEVKKPVVSNSSQPAMAREESFVEEISQQPDFDEEPLDDHPEDEYYRAAREIKVGTWVEFRGEEDKIERAKLSWISPISAKYLFVNRKGLKVADKTVVALATELRSGSALILEDVPLFDRALDAIVERLKNSSEGGADGSDAAEPDAEASASSESTQPSEPPADA